MDNGVVTNGVCYKESVNGGHDVWSCGADPSSSSSADHLVVMVNGILGSADDWKFAAEQFVHELPEKVLVHCSQRNVAKFTLDGVDVMGQRLAEEVLNVIKEKPNLSKISFLTHSVGGLVARYAIGILYQPSSNSNGSNGVHDKESDKIPKGTIGGLEAMNFITVATPHLGSRGNKQVPFLFGVPAIEKFASLVIHLIFRRTGKHLFLVDCDDGKPPLLKRMVEDNHEYCFMSALGTFRRRAAYSNVEYDHIVGWRTSSIRRVNQLPKCGDSVYEKYPHIVHEELCRPQTSQDCQSDSSEECIGDKIEEELVTSLSQVSWEKIDVSFHDSKLKYAAHSIIQVKYHHMHSDGADVIRHIIDHFMV